METMQIRFDEDTIVRHKKSGKLYRATGFPGSNSDRICVVGQRNDKDFGPVRFIDADKLEAVERT